MSMCSRTRWPYGSLRNIGSVIEYFARECTFELEADS
jgi:hypothetical protein